MGGATKKSELILSDEARKTYDHIWNVANESLKNLGIDTAFLQKIKDPHVFSTLMERRMAPRELADACDKLNHIFTAKNNLPEKITKDEELVKFLSDYIEKNFGKKIDIAIRERRHQVAAYTRMNTMLFPEGSYILDTIISIPHELAHMNESFGWKLNDLDALLMPMFKKSADSSAVVEYAKFTGIPPKDIGAELLAQNTYGYTVGTVFLIHLYDVGLYKPKDEKLRQNLEFSRFMLDKDMRRAYTRYKEGKAQFETLGLLNSDDEAVKARAALDLLMDMAQPTPQVFSEWSNRDLVVDSRQNEDSGSTMICKKSWEKRY
jgi:DNA-binding TFAR19-related protein (PDSD5 family)